MCWVSVCLVSHTKISIHLILFLGMAMKFNTVKCQLNTFCSSCAFPFFISWCFVALFYFKGSGQRVLMAQTLMLYAGHMTKTSLPQLMILAKCTCSLTPVPSQGWVFLFLFFYCEICHSIKSYSVKHFFFSLNLQAPSHIYGGHSSHVTNVAFLQDDSHLLSTGGKDTSILQWVLA